MKKASLQGMPKRTLPHAGVLIVCEIGPTGVDLACVTHPTPRWILERIAAEIRKDLGAEVSDRYGAAPEPNLTSSAMWQTDALPPPARTSPAPPSRVLVARVR
jgi:hypothetical protein